MSTPDAYATGAPCWVDLFTSDPERSSDFYSQILGWTVQDAGAEYGHYLNFSKDGKAVAGGMRNDGSAGVPDAWSVYLATPDAEATTDKAAASGGTVVLPPMAVMELGTMAMVTDPGGAAIGVWQPGLHKGFEVRAVTGAPAWFELNTRDYAAAVPFYRDVFGWDVHSMSDTPEFRYTTLGEGNDAQAGIMDAAAYLPEGVPSHWIVYFLVDEADATVAKAVELGATVVQQPEDTPYGRMAQLTDPTGANFKVVSGAPMFGN